jgi:hypothetical protein
VVSEMDSGKPSVRKARAYERSFCNVSEKAF